MIMRFAKTFFTQYIILLLVLSSFSNSFSQEKYRPPYDRFKKATDIGIGFGSSQYFGDIHPTNVLNSYIKSIRWNGNIALTRHISPFLSVRLNASWIRIAADDFTTTKNLVDGNSNKHDFQFLRNLSFRNDVQEASLQALINFKNGFYSLQDYKRPPFMPYLLVGIGVFHHKPKTRGLYDINEQKLSQWQNINLAGDAPTFNLNVPLGIGFRRKINDKLDITGEICYRISFTDLLDDVKDETYPNSTNPLSNRSRERYDALTGKDRSTSYNFVAARQGFPDFVGSGNAFVPTIGYPNPSPKRGEAGNDSYFTTSIQLHYYFVKKIVCPK